MVVSTLPYANEWWVYKMMDLSHIKAKAWNSQEGQTDSAYPNMIQIYLTEVKYGVLDTMEIRKITRQNELDRP